MSTYRLEEAAGALVMAGAIAWEMRQDVRVRALLAQKDERLAEIFERAGISIWLEDWTPVVRAIKGLMQDGVRDMQAHFTQYPDQARELRKKVLIKDVNAFTVEMMGAPGKDVFIGSLDRLLPDTDQTFIQWLVAFERGDRFYRSETHISRPDGSALDCLFTAALPHDIEGFANILVSCLDITEYKATQARLVAAETEIARASRVTTIGALTASIAHEVNSPLAAIVSNAEASLRWLRRAEPELAEAETSIAAVVQDAVRARDVVARTRSFLSNAPVRKLPLSLADAVRGAIVLIDRELRAYGVSVHFDADEDLPVVVADEIEIQQVMVNLMINGAQAMADKTGARDLTVTVRRSKDDIRVDVRDVGCGIEASRIPLIFDAFHSSKPGGMGMGLAICRTCVGSHGGRLWVTSAPERGATFHFTLPVLRPAQPSPQLTEQQTADR